MDTEIALVETRIREWCVRYLAKTLELESARINVDATFSRLGMDSAARIFCLVAIEEWLGIQLPGELIFEHETAAELARSLARRSDVAHAVHQRANREGAPSR